MKRGKTVTLTEEPGGIIPAGTHQVSRVNPDGSFNAGRHTSVCSPRSGQGATARTNWPVPGFAQLALPPCRRQPPAAKDDRADSVSCLISPTLGKRGPG